MAGGALTGLAGLAGMPQGYLSTYNQMLNLAAQDALGKGLQALAGGQPGSPPIQPQPPAGAAPPAPGGFQAPPMLGAGTAATPGIRPLGALPALSQAGPMPGGQPIAAGAPRMAAPAGPVPATAPHPGAGTGVAPAAPAFMVGGGGGASAPGGQSDWQSIMRAIVRANPGAAPDVIAAAVTKAMPLMNAASQQEWRQLHSMIMEEGLNIRQGALQQGEERLQQGQQRVDLANQREQRLSAHMQWAEDFHAQELRMKAEQLRQKATQFSTTMTLKQRQEALKEWDNAERAYDSYMRNRISSAANLSGQDKADAKKELDRRWGEYDEGRRALQDQWKAAKPGGTGPAAGGASSAAPGGNPTTPQGRVNEDFSAAGQGTPMPPAVLSKLRNDIQQHPDLRDQLLQAYQQKGWLVPPGL